MSFSPGDYVRHEYSWKRAAEVPPASGWHVWLSPRRAGLAVCDMQVRLTGLTGIRTQAYMLPCLPGMAEPGGQPEWGQRPGMLPRA